MPVAMPSATPAPSSTMASGTAPPRSRGPFVLQNHLLLEAIVAHVPELADIIALSLVSRLLHAHVHAVWPRTASELSFRCTPYARTPHVTRLVRRYLLGDAGSPLQNRLLDDGRVVRIGGGPPGSHYTDAWRHLTHLDLSGSRVDTAAVKLFIAASAGGRIASLGVGLSGVHGPFAKDFDGCGEGALRLLRDQGLRLETICVTECRNVNIVNLNVFLRKIITVVSAEKRREVKLAAIQPGNPAANPNANQPHNAPGQAAHQLLAIIQPAANPAPPNPQDGLHAWGMGGDDEVQTIVSPLASTVDELSEYGLDCLSLRRLEVANVKGLYVFPSHKYRGKKEWEYRQECPFARNVAHLNAVAGCLGIDVDVIFCQGATCAGGLDDERYRNMTPPPTLSHHRSTYKNPLPRLPGERVLVADDSRVFRIPRHCIGDTVPAQPLPAPGAQVPAAQVPAAWMNLPTQFPPPALAAPYHPLTVTHALANAGLATNNHVQMAQVAQLVAQHANVFGGGPAQQAPPAHLTQAALQLLNAQPQLHPLQGAQPPAPPPPATTTAATIGDGSTVADDDGDGDGNDSDSTMSDLMSVAPASSTATAAATPNPPSTTATATTATADAAAAAAPNNTAAPTGLAAAANALGLGFAPGLAAAMQHPHPQNAQPAPGIGVSLDLRRSMASAADNAAASARGGANTVREIAMMDGPRGLCEGCGREVWLCERCNQFWQVCCGGCAGQMGAAP